MQDAIIIEQLELWAFVGVSEEERSVAQRLAVSLEIQPSDGLKGVEDKIENTIDYFEVCQKIQALAAERPRRLIETLAEEMAQLVLDEFPVFSVVVELRKFIMSNTAYVAVRVSMGN